MQSLQVISGNGTLLWYGISLADDCSVSSFVVRCWIYVGMADNYMSCGQSMQEWFLIVTGCRALGFH